MKTTLLTIAIVLGAALVQPALATEWKAGFEAVQVRDKSFAPFEGGLSDVWHPGTFKAVDTLRLEGGVTPWKNTDVLFGIRMGEESTDLENISTQLWLFEPLAGVRRRYPLHERVEVYGQATLSLPYMRMSFDAPQPENYWAVFPALTPAVGVLFFPPVEKGRSPLGVSAEIGYGSPAPLAFSKHKGVSPGTLDYNGVTYGIYMNLRLGETEQPPEPPEVHQP